MKITGFREKRATKGKDLVAEAEFVFVTKKDGKFHPHGLML